MERQYKKGQTKYTANHADSEDILIDLEIIEKVTIQIHRTNHTPQRHFQKKKPMPGSEQRGAVLEKKKKKKPRKYSKVDKSPFHSKKQVMDKCFLPTMTCGCQAWSLNKQLTNKLRTTQRAMGMKMLGLKLQDKIPCSEIRERTKIIDTVEYRLKQK